MARQESPTAPSERELDILKVFWEVGEVPVRVIHQKMAPNGEFAITTIQTLVRIMAEKGFLTTFCAVDAQGGHAATPAPTDAPAKVSQEEIQHNREYNLYPRRKRSRLSNICR